MGQEQHWICRLNKMSGPKREHVMVGFRKCDKFYSSSNIINCEDV